MSIEVAKRNGPCTKTENYEANSWQWGSYVIGWAEIKASKVLNQLRQVLRGRIQMFLYPKIEWMNMFLKVNYNCPKIPTQVKTFDAKIIFHSRKILLGDTK